MLLPALGKAKAKGQSVHCLNNTKQMALAWIMYAGDNEDKLANNFGNGSIDARPAENWVAGRMDHCGPEHQQDADDARHPGPVHGPERFGL